ncbi:MAG: pirin family protein [Homoserinimonas sp.]
MSNQERDPKELVASAERRDGFRLLEPRDVPLGGPRAMDVRRTLPQRGHSLIGAWCFADHYGPDDVAVTGGMRVPPHPHTGLQTVSWLFAGEIEHRDSSGAHAMVRPGELNLMTAGRGIQHSEVSTESTRMLHGVQLWTALPDAVRHTTPTFEHYVPPVIEFPEGSIRVFMGTLVGQRSPVTTFSPLVGAQVDLKAGQSITLPIASSFEHGMLVDAGRVRVEGNEVPVSHIAYLGPGREQLKLEATTATRLVLIGGEPLGEEIVMWWNFIGRSHDDVAASRAQWQSEVVGGGTHAGHFGEVRGYDGAPLPAPTMPTVRLKPRG